VSFTQGGGASAGGSIDVGVGEVSGGVDVNTSTTTTGYDTNRDGVLDTSSVLYNSYKREMEGIGYGYP
jgi:hypothetical protein